MSKTITAYLGPPGGGGGGPPSSSELLLLPCAACSQHYTIHKIITLFIFVKLDHHRLHGASHKIITLLHNRASNKILTLLHNGASHKIITLFIFG
jgi:hypothetical protein